MKKPYKNRVFLFLSIFLTICLLFIISGTAIYAVLIRLDRRSDDSLSASAQSKSVHDPIHNSFSAHPLLKVQEKASPFSQSASALKMQERIPVISDIRWPRPLPEAVPAVPDEGCFTYEELDDGTLRIIGYDESLNTKNPYQIIIPAAIDGKKVSTVGSGALCMPDSTPFYLQELTISEGITTLEEYMLAGTYDLSFVSVPDSVTSIDEHTFWEREDYPPLGVTISCSDTSCAYEYARESRLAVHITSPTLPENAFLSEYAQASRYPYRGHFRIEGDQHNYIVIEYLDPRIPERLYGDEYGTSFYNEFRVLVLDKDTGEILQSLDDTMASDADFSFLQWVYSANLLSNTDVNFDGIKDIVIYEGVSGTGAAAYDALFAYNESSGQYEFICRIDNAGIRPDKQCIYSYSRGGAALHYIDRYEYIDGELTWVASLKEEGIDNDGVTVTDSRLIDGEWVIYRSETFYPRNPSAENAWQDAYKQAEVLYVNDGYWDQ